MARVISLSRPVGRTVRRRITIIIVEPLRRPQTTIFCDSITGKEQVNFHASGVGWTLEIHHPTHLGIPLVRSVNAPASVARKATPARRGYLFKTCNVLGALARKR